MKYELPKMRYPYDAMEPYIDQKTMEVHHLKHHASYVEKMNQGLSATPEFQRPIEELLAELRTLPPDIANLVLTQGGGHANHTLFWTLLSPTQRKQDPNPEFLKDLKNNFGSFENFKNVFTDVSIKHFASGWAWLCTDRKGRMQVFSTKDHESPISQHLIPLLVLDLWEHAYYLNYQNRRPEFVQAFWNIVNWKEVALRWEEFSKTGNTAREWKIAS